MTIKTLIPLALAAMAMPAFSATIYYDTNTTLYSLDPTTGVSTQIATGFSGARGITQGADGLLYVADFTANQVYQIDGSGNKTAFGPTISQAYGLLTQGSNILVSSFNSTGNIATVDSTGSVSSTLNTGYLNVADMTIGPDGNLYFGAAGAAGVVKFDGTNYSLYANMSGDGGSQPTPRGLFFDADGNLLVADSAALNGNGPGIYEFAAGDQAKTTIFDDGNGGSIGAGNIKGLILDPDDGLFYFADNTHNAIYSLAANGTGLTNVTGTGQNAITGPQEMYVSTIAATPEPGTIGLMFGGLSALLFGARKLRSRA